MNDFELTRLAYKAAFSGAELTEDKDMMRHFKPLEDDGDALRLAVKLNLLILPYPNDNAVRVTRLDMQDVIVSFGTPPDPLAATRRAIVLAAAEIGKEMP